MIIRFEGSLPLDRQCHKSKGNHESTLIIDVPADNLKKVQQLIREGAEKALTVYVFDEEGAKELENGALQPEPVAAGGFRVDGE